jgi:hypothetical protein
MLRANITKMLQGEMPKPKIKSESALFNALDNSKLQRRQIIEVNGGLLPYSSFNKKKSYMIQSMLEYTPREENNDPMAALQNNPMSNPTAMLGMMKGQMFTPIIFSVQFYIIQFFFSGVIVGKLNFPLTQTFRNMLQKEISVERLDVKYVSGLSLYFLSFMAIFKLLSLFKSPDLLKRSKFRDPLADEYDKKVNKKALKNMAKMMSPMAASPGMGGAPMPPMPGLGAAQGNQKVKQFEDAKKNSRFIDHSFYLKEADEKLIEMWE